jgi:hypothetical protein
MQKYQTASQLSSIEFRRLTGVQKTTFMDIAAIVKEAKNKASGRVNHFIFQLNIKLLKN